MKTWVVIILLCSSCIIRKATERRLAVRSVVLTNQQLTDSVNKQSFEIAEIKRGFVFMDTLFFKKLPDGTITFRDSITFNTGTFMKLYVGVPKCDTLAVEISLEDSFEKD